MSTPLMRGRRGTSLLEADPPFIPAPEPVFEERFPWIGSVPWDIEGDKPDDPTMRLFFLLCTDIGRDFVDPHTAQAWVEQDAAEGVEANIQAAIQLLREYKAYGWPL